MKSFVLLLRDGHLWLHCGIPVQYCILFSVNAKKNKRALSLDKVIPQCLDKKKNVHRLVDEARLVAPPHLLSPSPLPLPPLEKKDNTVWNLTYLIKRHFNNVFGHQLHPTLVLVISFCLRLRTLLLGLRRTGLTISLPSLREGNASKPGLRCIQKELWSKPARLQICAWLCSSKKDTQDG